MSRKEIRIFQMFGIQFPEYLEWKKSPDMTGKAMEVPGVFAVLKRLLRDVLVNNLLCSCLNVKLRLI